MHNSSIKKVLLILNLTTFMYHSATQAAAHTQVEIAGATFPAAAAMPRPLSPRASATLATGLSQAAPAAAVAAKTAWYNPFGKSSSSSSSSAAPKKGKGLFSTSHNVGEETRDLIGGIADKALTVAARGTVQVSSAAASFKKGAEAIGTGLSDISKTLPAAAAGLGNSASAGAAHLPQTTQNLKETARILGHAGLMATATAGKYVEDTVNIAGIRAVQAVDVGGDRLVQAVQALEPSVARLENIHLSLPLLAYRIVKSGTLVIGGGFVTKKGMDLMVDGFKKYINSNSDPEKRARIRKEGFWLGIGGLVVAVVGAIGIYEGKPIIRPAAPVPVRIIPPADRAV